MGTLTLATVCWEPEKKTQTGGLPHDEGPEGEGLQPETPAPPLPAGAQCELRKWPHEITRDPAPPAFPPAALTTSPKKQAQAV